MNFTFRGLMCPVFTPFKPDFSLNLDKIPEYALYLKKNNVRGILGKLRSNPLMNYIDPKHNLNI